MEQSPDGGKRDWRLMLLIEKFVEDAHNLYTRVLERSAGVLAGVKNPPLFLKNTASCVADWE